MGLFSITVILACIVLFYIIHKNYMKQFSRFEGFTQNDRFLLKTGGDSYDDFYGEIYDELMLPKERVVFETDKILSMIMPSKEHSVMLDAGSGTGELVHYLKDQGYRAYGIDQSKDMIDISQTKYENIEIKHGCVTDSMSYDRSLFTHIFCMSFTIYEMDRKQKQRFFNNCSHWLQTNGYFILHLAEKDKFNTIVPAGKHPLLGTTEQLEENRIRKTVVKFPDFEYKSEYLDIFKEDERMFHKETFVDKYTQNIRHNEKIMYMEPVEEIVHMVLSSGFVAKGQFTLENGPSRDKYQTIYIFEKI